ncbi:MAG: M56 family metallopeptidase [Reichenbachiella sp.]|uniref:M56 family metallopeptidase n=1 Tax=Reichenbachiella sp. TaxID=2184521 RepID=UPI00326382DE
MDRIIWFLAESSIMLICLYTLYLLILRRETFFALNRYYLLSIVVFSLLFPLLSFDFDPPKVAVVQRPIEEISKVRLSYYDAFEEWSFANGGVVRSNGESLEGLLSDVSSMDLILWVLASIYVIGLIFCWSCTFWTVQWIYQLIGKHSHVHRDDLTIVLVDKPIAPFSFMKYVFIPKEMTNSKEYDHILAHEATHVRQRHSLDLIIVQLIAAIHWFNPVIWRLIKSLKTTHEYIADNNILNEGYSLVEYQTLLLRQLISNNSYGLVHNFNLSFIKKRITMMKSKKSGWTGKVKVAFVLIGTIIFSIAAVQCNSLVEEQVAITSEGSSANIIADGISLPVLSATHGQVDLSANNSLELTVASNKITINGKSVEVAGIMSEIASSKLDESGIIVMRVDRNQSMGLIREIHTVLRKADRRKVLHLGQTEAGERAESALLLPPMPGDTRPGVPQLPTIDDEYIARTGIEVLKIKFGDDEGISNQIKVDAMVRKHMQNQSSNYVVSAKFENNDTYDTYLRNLVYIKEAFNQIYMERAKEMFDKDFFELDKYNPDEKEQYRAVRKGIPMAISIANES